MFIIIYFVLTWAFTSSFAQNGNTCSKSHDEQMLEKIIRLEYKMELMEKHDAKQDAHISEFNDSQTAERIVMMDEMHNLRTTVTEQLLQSRKAMQSNAKEFEKIKLELTELSEDVERMELPPLVAFNALGPATQTLAVKTGTIIKFPKILLNEGLGYNNWTGVFTAPVGGLYLFTVHFCHPGAKYAIVGINQNGNMRALSSIGSTNNYTCASVNTLLMVNVGDRINIASYYDETVLIDNHYRRSSFIGILLRV